MAHGFWFPKELLPEATDRQRILSIWQKGDVVERFATGLLLRASSPRSVRAEISPGTPLEQREMGRGKVLAAAPFSEDEWRHLSPPPGSVVIVSGGEAIVLQDGVPEDLSEWLDCRNFVCGVPHSLGTAPEVSLVLERSEFDAREKLAGVPSADSQLAGVMDAIRHRREHGIVLSPSRSNAGVWRFLPQGIFTLGEARFSGWRPLFGVPVDDPSLQNALRPLISLAWFAPLWRDSTPSARNSRSLAASRGRKRAITVPASAVGSIPPRETFRRLFGRTAMLLHLGGLIGRPQARYIARMMRMFENGDLAEALRHAIPLAGETERELPPALGTPRPRENLQISPQVAMAHSGFNFGPDVNDHLRKLYRGAFTQLQTQNRIDEAAFVLAELLGSSEEAVAFLEKHGRLRLAAEMAEARHLPPGLVVRQWFIAGDRDRAVLFARQSEAFGDAVSRLERGGHDEEANALRLLWGESLAQAGAYRAAVEAVWPVEDARPIALDWIQQGVALGGIAGARLLARYIALEPANRAAWQSTVEELLDDEDAENAAARHAFAESLEQGETEASHVAARMIARAAVRSLARDAASGAYRSEPHQYRRLLNLASDAALRADAAALPPAPPEPELGTETPGQPLRFVIESGDTTGVSILDATILPDGSCVAALGESGVRILSRRGRIRAVLSQPAYRLVMADSGSRALAVAPRGEVVRLAHLDFASCQSSYWDEATLQIGANTYDGSQWIAASSTEILSIDTLAVKPGALWTSGETSGHVVMLDRAVDSVAAMVHSSGVADAWNQPCEPWEKTEIWRFEGTPLVLRERKSVPPPIAGAFEPQRTLTPSGKLLVAACHALPQTPLVSSAPFSSADTSAPVGADMSKPILLGHNQRVAHLGDASIGQTPMPPVASDSWIAVGTRAEDGMRCFILDEKLLQVRAIFLLQDASQIGIRFLGDDLILCDDVGRLLVYDCGRRVLRRDFRLT